MTVDLASILSEFERTCSDPSELDTFMATLDSNPEMHSSIFNALENIHNSNNSKDLKDLLALLLKWHRSKNRHHLVLQFMPQLLLIALTRRAKNPHLDSFLLSVYNESVNDANGQPQKAQVRLESLIKGSVYHDGAKITDPLTNSGEMRMPQYRQHTAINAQSRMEVVEEANP